MESMSNAPYLLRNARFGYRLGDGTLEDAMLEDGLRDPWSGKLMYEQASAVADELGLERADLDGWALRSHERAIAAIDAGRFAAEIVPVEVAGRRSATQVEVDEGPRRDTSLEALAALRPLTQEHPTHTAGNSPGVTDGAAALVVADEEWARGRGLDAARPDPAAWERPRTGTTRSHACRRRLRASRWSEPGSHTDAVDRYEINEAFASVALQSSRELGADPERVNVDGGAVALGHPVGASGARLLATLVRQLGRDGRRDRRRGDLLGRRTGRRDGARGPRRVSDRILVVGAGQMGAGIAQVAATAGMDVTLVDVDEPALDARARGDPAARSRVCTRRARSTIPTLCSPASRRRPISRRAATAALMIEAAPERFELKAELFRRADELLDPAAILASNTSSIPIGRLAACTGAPGQRVRDALLQPGADAPAGRADPWARHLG